MASSLIRAFAPAPTRDDHVRSVETVIVDVPLKRAHFHATGTHSGQSYCFVTLLTEGGAIGIGEGVTPGGGAFWGGESVETIHTVIQHYLAPAIVGMSVLDHEPILAAMDRAAAANQFAKAALDMAVHDATGRILGVPISALYGGRARTAMPVLWALATAQEEADIADARAKLASGSHRTFKLKIGKGDPRAETRRAVRTAEAIRGIEADTRLTVDLNGAWDEPSAARHLPELQAAGIDLVEQPVPAWNRGAMARLAARLDMAVMADEGLWDQHDAFDAIAHGQTDVLAVKVAKGGGLRRAYKKAAVGEAAGTPLYGGMALESSIGTAASLQLFAALHDLPWGSELIGPLLIADDFATEPVCYEGPNILVPTPERPGLGVELDLGKVAHYRRR